MLGATEEHNALAQNCQSFFYVTTRVTHGTIPGDGCFPQSIQDLSLYFYPTSTALPSNNSGGRGGGNLQQHSCL